MPGAALCTWDTSVNEIGRDTCARSQHVGFLEEFLALNKPSGKEIKRVSVTEEDHLQPNTAS